MSACAEHLAAITDIAVWLSTGLINLFAYVQASGRRPSTAESPGGELFSQARSGTLPGIARPASAASSSGNLSPGLSPCGALVAKAVREAGREGAGQVWQPLASRQMDAWAPVQAPTHSLSAPAVWPQAQVPSLPHQVCYFHLTISPGSIVSATDILQCRWRTQTDSAGLKSKGR